MAKAIKITPAGQHRFLIQVGNGRGHSYTLERALGVLKRRIGAMIERTGHGATIYIQFPTTSKATGASTDIITAEALTQFIKAS